MVLKELFARFGLDLNEASFVRGQLAVEGIKLAVRGLATVINRAAMAFPNMISSTVEAADKFDEAAQSTGVNAAALQELTYAAGFSGLALEGLSGALGIFAKNAGNARDGNEQMQKSFARVGVSMADLRNKTPDELLMQIADQFAAMPDGMNKTALAMEVFGKSGKTLIPFLNAGASGIEALRAEARELGIVMSEDMLKAGAAVDDSMGKLKGSLTGLKYEVIGPLLPDLRALVDGFVKWFKANRDVIKQRLDKVLAVVRLAAKALLGVLVATGKILGFLIDRWKLVSVIIGSWLLASLVAAKGGFFALGASALRAGAAMVLAGLQAAAAWVLAAAPIIAIASLIALAILIVEDLYVALTGGESLIGNLMDKWAKFLAAWLTDNEEDPWWLRGIKGFLYIITNLGDAWDAAVEYWRGLFTRFFAWIDQKINGIRKAIDKVNPFSVGSGETSGIRGVAGVAGEPEAVRAARRGTAVLRGLTGPAEVSTGAAPSVGAGAAGSKRTNISNTISVTANTKQDAEAIGTHVQGVLEDWFEGKMGAALAALGG